jgi:hypothetical protein
MATIRELRDREIVLRSLREGIDTSNATGRMVAGLRRGRRGRAGGDAAARLEAWRLCGFRIGRLRRHGCY